MAGKFRVSVFRRWRLIGVCRVQEDNAGGQRRLLLWLVSSSPADALGRRETS